MKFLGPVRFQLNNRSALAYTGISRKFLQMAKDRMGANRAFWVRYLPDGTKIIVSSLGGVDQVWIEAATGQPEPVIRYNSAFFISQIAAIPNANLEVIWYDPLGDINTPIWLKESEDYKDSAGTAQFPNPILRPGGVVTDSGVASRSNPLGSQGYEISALPSVPSISRIISWIYNGKICSLNRVSTQLQLYWKKFTEGMTLETGDLFDEDLFPNGWRLSSTANWPAGRPTTYGSVLIAPDTNEILIYDPIKDFPDISLKINDNIIQGVTELEKTFPAKSLAGSISWDYEKNALAGTRNNFSRINDSFPSTTVDHFMDYTGNRAEITISGTYSEKDDWQYTGERGGWQGDPSGDYLIVGDHQDEINIDLNLTIGGLTIPILVYRYKLDFTQEADSSDLGQLLWTQTSFSLTNIGSGYYVRVYHEYGIILSWTNTSGAFDDESTTQFEDTIIVRLHDIAGNTLWSDTFISRPIFLNNPITTGGSSTNTCDTLILPPQTPTAMFCYPPSDGEDYPASETCQLADSESCSKNRGFSWNPGNEFVGLAGASVTLDSFTKLPNGAVAFVVSSGGVVGEDTEIRHIVINPDKSITQMSSIVPDISLVDPDSPPSISSI